MNRPEEQKAWQLYWDIEINNHIPTPEERILHGRLHYRLHNEKYTSVRSINESFFDLQRFTEELAKL